MSILDLAPLHFSDEGRLPRNLREQVCRARGVVVSTHLIADEVRRELGAEKVWLIPPAVGDRFYEHRSSVNESVHPYVLHVGGATERKGLDGLARAWPVVRAADPDLDLVMVGPVHATGRTKLLRLDGVRWVGQADDETVLDLMIGARAVVVPSTYEGFGMPVAESMALGSPVVVLAGTAPAEVGGDAAFCAATGMADDLAEAILGAVVAREIEPRRLADGVLTAQQWTVSHICRVQMQVYQEAFGG
ncbi:glycosyltransferase [Rhodococcus antarcticus]|uniref:Glycosyltransferase n=1 Tax=Rhodococcus antarcticus TaxID=2987751 RepID=A0ABY6NZW2_9NOCA|nr:glycosyltransferase [Rhodococcus antarcticus]UZJ24957.1 glycosyltransferase [Rhodococcus antarcticus]